MKLRKAENFLPGSSGSVSDPFGCPTSDHSAKAVASGASKPPVQCSRSQVWPRLPSRCPASPAPVARCSTWHNGTMIPDSTTIPQDPQGFSATSALCNKSENAANTWDTIWYNGCSWLKRIMVNYAVLAKIVAFIYPYVGQRHILWAVPVSLSEYLWREPSGPINHDQSSFWVKNVP